MNRCVEIACPICGNLDGASLGQSVIFGKLRWYVSTNCPRCRHVSEEDGVGFPPQTHREKLLVSGGTWNLVVDVQFRVAFLKTLRELVSVSFAEASKIKFPKAFSGTKAEVEWVLYHATAAGISAIAEQQTDSGSK